MNRKEISSQSTVSVPAIDRCPECMHPWTDFDECHFHDCRYFWVDNELDDEDPIFVDDNFV